MRVGRKKLCYEMPDWLYNAVKEMSYELNMTVTMIHIKALAEYVKNYNLDYKDDEK